MKSLQDIYEEYRQIPNQMIDGMHSEWGGDKGLTHSYIEIYEKLFNPIRNNPVNLLEIGVMYGSSLKMWKKYFENGNITGFDIRPHVLKYNEERIRSFICNATIESDIKKTLKDNEQFDIIIDDGSHRIEDQLKTFHILFETRLKPNGYYIIEDVQNFDTNKKYFEKLHKNVSIIDRRNVKNRYDDVLIIIKKDSQTDLFKGSNTEDYWCQKHTQMYEVNKPFDFSKMTDLSYIKVANDLIQTNQTEINRKSILDIGCAVGKASYFYKKNMPNFDVNGIDFSKSAIDAAKIKAPDVNFECVDFTKQKLKNDYGVITMLETIEHIQEGLNYVILDDILNHCEYAVISTVDTEDDCFGEHISHYKLDTFEKRGYNVIWKTYLDEIKMPNGIFHYMIFFIKGNLN